MAHVPGSSANVAARASVAASSFVAGVVRHEAAIGATINAGNRLFDSLQIIDIFVEEQS
jgi:hypothetical protein